MVLTTPLRCSTSLNFSSASGASAAGRRRFAPTAGGGGAALSLSAILLCATHSADSSSALEQTPLRFKCHCSPTFLNCLAYAVVRWMSKLSNCAAFAPVPMTA